VKSKKLQLHIRKEVFSHCFFTFHFPLFTLLAIFAAKSIPLNSISMPHLSVVIPVYKTSATLGRCIDSILAQTFGDWEAIIVDDGSADECASMCDSYATQDSRISVIHKANGGLSDARNAGTEVAKGDWITYVDSDDYIAADTFQAIIDAAESEDEVEVIEYPAIVKQGHQSEHRLDFNDELYPDIKTYWLETRAYLHTYACNKAVRCYLAKSTEFPVGKKFEDSWWFPQVLSKDPQVMTISGGCYFYTWNDHGITATADGRDILSLLSAGIHASETLGIPVSSNDASSWYLSLLNTQIDVCRQLHTTPILPARRLPLSAATSWSERMKITILNTLGINALCRIMRMMPQR